MVSKKSNTVILVLLFTDFLVKWLKALSQSSTSFKEIFNLESRKLDRVVKCDICCSLPESLYQLRYSLDWSHRDLKKWVYFFLVKKSLAVQGWYCDYQLPVSHPYSSQGEGIFLSHCHIWLQRKLEFSLAGQPYEERRNRHCSLLHHGGK